VRPGKALTAGVAALAVGAMTVAGCSASTPPTSAGTPAASAGAPTNGTAPTTGTQPGAIDPAATTAVPAQTHCTSAFAARCLTPQQVETAYNLGPLYAHGITGKGETIVIVDSFGSPTIAHDLAVFDQQFKLPAPPSFSVITPDGKTPQWDASDSDMTGWGGETTLDVEYAHTIAPGASILLVETPVSETEGVTGFPQIVEGENYVIKHHLGDVISQSFEATEQTFSGGLNQINQYHLRSAYELAAGEKDGPTVLAPSGDTGAADVELNGSTYYTHPVTSWPDSDPLVTGVGGTELVAGSHGTFTSVAWNDTADTHIGGGTSPYATGGGRSVLFQRPSYQNGVANIVGTARGVPDVSMNAACSSPVFTYQSFPQSGTPAGWYPSCGTSEATPEFAGVVALADQVAGHALGVINPTLYKLSAAKAPGIVPVTSGDNTVTFAQNGTTYTVNGFHAQAGYSLVDGVGTANGWYLAYELAGQTPPS
jgi:subtilase family serine protease